MPSPSCLAPFSCCRLLGVFTVHFWASCTAPCPTLLFPSVTRAKGRGGAWYGSARARGMGVTQLKRPPGQAPRALVLALVYDGSTLLPPRHLLRLMEKRVLQAGAVTVPASLCACLDHAPPHNKGKSKVQRG